MGVPPLARSIERRAADVRWRMVCERCGHCWAVNKLDWVKSGSSMTQINTNVFEDEYNPSSDNAKGTVTCQVGMSSCALSEGMRRGHDDGGRGRDAVPSPRCCRFSPTYLADHDDGGRGRDAAPSSRCCRFSGPRTLPTMMMGAGGVMLPPSSWSTR